MVIHERTDACVSYASQLCGLHLIKLTFVQVGPCRTTNRCYQKPMFRQSRACEMLALYAGQVKHWHSTKHDELCQRM